MKFFRYSLGIFNLNHVVGLFYADQNKKSLARSDWNALSPEDRSLRVVLSTGVEFYFSDGADRLLAYLENAAGDRQ